MATLAYHLEVVGWSGPLLLGCLALLYLLAGEQLVALFRAAGPGRELRRILERSLAHGDLAAALGAAAATRGAVARVALRILREGLREPAAQEAAAQEALAREVPPLERRLGVISVVGSVAVLLGLLGTLTGLAQPFCAPPDAASKAVRLAKGISESMGATVGGLALAVTSLLFVNLLRGLARRQIAELQLEARALRNALVSHRTRLRLTCGERELRPRLAHRGYRRLD